MVWAKTGSGVVTTTTTVPPTTTTTTAAPTTTTTTVNPITLDPLYDKKVAFFGSSSSADGYAGFKKYYRFIQDRTGMVPVPVAIAGSLLQSAVVDYTTQAGNQLKQIDDMTTNVDMVIGQIGLNDERFSATLGTMGSTNVTNFYGALDVMCRKLYDKFPTKPLAIMTGQYFTPNSATSSAYVDAIKLVCGKYGIPVLELMKVGKVPYSYDTWRTAHVPDGLHMDDVSNQQMSYVVESFLRSLLGK